MEIRQLRYFVAVAEEGSFSAAAGRLHMTQPPLSQSISKLETSLGTRLFERQQRQTPRLTPQGQLLLHEARRILHQVDEVESMIGRSNDQWPLRVGAIPTVISGLLPTVVPRMRARYPTALVLMLETEERDFLHAIQASAVDVGFTRATRLVPGMVIRPLLHEPLYAALYDWHPLAGRDQIDLAELRADDFVLFPRDDAPRAHDHIVQACIRSGFSPNVLLEAKNDLALLSFVACGLVVSLVPFLSTLAHVEGVCFVRVDTWATTPLSLVHRSDSENPYISPFEDFVITRIRELATTFRITEYLQI